LFKAEIAFYT